MLASINKSCHYRDQTKMNPTKEEMKAGRGLLGKKAALEGRVYKRGIGSKSA